MTKSNRIEFHNLLCDCIGSTNVYFQPPESVKLKYPCIVYNLAPGRYTYADDELYKKTCAYEVTYICKDPDSEVPDKIEHAFKYLRTNRIFATDGLYHHNFTIHYKN